MSTVMTWQMRSTSSSDTELLGEKLGANLRGGEVIELVSDLGGGKTTLTKGIVRGAGSTERVASPTFTVSREYRTPVCTIVHFDFYRLAEAGIVARELDEFIGDQAYAVIIEWADIVQDVLPPERLTIQISQAGNDERTITVMYPEALAYLLEGIAA